MSFLKHCKANHLQNIFVLMDEKILHLMHLLQKKSFFKQTFKILIILKSEVTLGKGARFAPLINLQLSLVPWEEKDDNVLSSHYMEGQ